MNKYDPILIPIIRRTLPNVIAKDICLVQPMNAGVLFAEGTKMPQIRYSIAEQKFDKNKVIYCPHDAEQMVPGKALNDRLPVELIDVFKCPICGHSDDGL